MAYGEELEYHLRVNDSKCGEAFARVTHSIGISLLRLRMEALGSESSHAPGIHRSHKLFPLEMISSCSGTRPIKPSRSHKYFRLQMPPPDNSHFSMVERMMTSHRGSGI